MSFRATSSAAIALLCFSAAASAGPAGAPPPAAGVAALKAEEAHLAENVKAGEPVEPELLKVVRSGIAIIGTQYFPGLREAEGRELLKAAEQDFQTLPAADAEARQSECLKEGEALYAGAS